MREGEREREREREREKEAGGERRRWWLYMCAFVRVLDVFRRGGVVASSCGA